MIGKTVRELLQQDVFSKEDIVRLLLSDGDDRQQLFLKAREVKLREVGDKVYFRGLIEYSNVCSKNCFYCGIRKSNKKVSRYTLTDKEVLDAAAFAHAEKFGSIVIQAGEVSSETHIARIERLILAIKELSHGELGITLSLGEQTHETYSRWFSAGAHRYLLRIETSDKNLYQELHPSDHRFDVRLSCLHFLKQIGYQVGTGVMIGLPFQTVEHLADDLLFMQHFDVDMVGMGPYIEHADTPLFQCNNLSWDLQQRFSMSLKMVAILRLLMKDINIAATTALQAIDPLGREKAIDAGANIVMPNITPGKYRNDYLLYENKPCVDEEPDQCLGCLDARLSLVNSKIGYGEWGDSHHFSLRKNTKDG
ncbi:MAG TPA: [FeFe] hydrogenase H-cluster radical SAM maturase HydE [Prolixibacteraceae bacterium]|nr:[FeFe] hydrogenase H-cluster radical SAM maturase HydE [Prolixibacteraceae bacterium]HQN92797.1 [FeFe] hydrogenase H-cluster radical SAM maturase HydE [Prolixibacteraceae bacterium]